MSIVKDIDALLPQTQCQECGYAGCLPYAEALAQGIAPIDRCPPGGLKTLKALGKLLSIDPTPFENDMESRTRAPALAFIREAECIGCTKCIQACPVDAIVGSSKSLHHVIAHGCTGCGLCVEPCPVDCIDIVEQNQPTYDPNIARQRYHAREIRVLRLEREKQDIYREKKRLAHVSKDNASDKSAKQRYILEALARSKAKK